MMIRSMNGSEAHTFRFGAAVGRGVILLVLVLCAFSRPGSAQQWYSHCRDCPQAGRGLASSGWLGPFSSEDACDAADEKQRAIGWDFPRCERSGGPSPGESSRTGCPPNCKSPGIAAAKGFF